MAIACVLERDAGVYECKKCGERFVPTMKAYVMAAWHHVEALEMPEMRQKEQWEKAFGQI